MYPAQIIINNNLRAGKILWKFTSETEISHQPIESISLIIIIKDWTTTFGIERSPETDQ